jgi:hypothetical protein
MGPHQLRSLGELHEFREFDLMVIFQASGCEGMALNLLEGRPISTNEHLTAEIANDLAQQKGYAPIFDLSGPREQLFSDARSAVEALFNSSIWRERDTTRTRRI